VLLTVPFFSGLDTQKLILPVFGLSHAQLRQVVVECYDHVAEYVVELDIGHGPAIRIRLDLACYLERLLFLHASLLLTLKALAIFRVVADRISIALSLSVKRRSERFRSFL